VNAAGDFFDKQYTDEHLPLPLYFRLLRRWERSHFAVAEKLLGSGESLLDVGCGEGELERRVAGNFQRVVALDVSPLALQKAAAHPEAQRFRERITWQVVDANQPLPFADASFSAVVTMTALQYLLDPEAFLAESFRVLRPGGRFVVEVPNMAYLPQRLRLLFGYPIKTSFYPHGIDGGNLHYFTVGLLKRLLREAGYAVRQVSASGVFAPLRTWWVSLLCGNMIVLAEKPA